jgi:hypothetical protein
MNRPANSKAPLLQERHVPESISTHTVHSLWNLNMKASNLARPCRHGIGSHALLVLLAFMVAAPSASAQGTLLFDTMAVDARVWHPERCEPVTGEEFVAQLYVEEQGPVGVPLPFGSGSEAGYVLGGEVVVPSVAPGNLVTVVMRIWEPGFDSYEEAVAAGSAHGLTNPVTVLLGEPGAPTTLFGLEALWGACPSEVTLRMELGESEVSLVWEMQGFPSGYIVVPQEAEHPTGPWSDVEGWWNPVNGRVNPPNPLSLQKAEGVRFYRMRLTASIGP